MAAFDCHLWVVDAEADQFVDNRLLEAAFQSGGAGCRRCVRCVGRDDQDGQGRAVLTDLELDDFPVAGEQGEVQGVDGDRGAVAGGKGEDVVAAAVDCAGADQAASARTRLGIQGDDVGDFQPDQRLHQVVEVGDEQSRAGLAGRHRLPVGVDVLDQGGVLEQVNALVVLALGANNPSVLP